jgi:hypothetical protein
MSPLDTTHAYGAGTYTHLPVAPVIDDFDPSVEVLSLTLSEDDIGQPLVLRDLADMSGVRIEVGGRLLAVLTGVTADDLDEDCLQFDFEE